MEKNDLAVGCVVDMVFEQFASKITIQGLSKYHDQNGKRLHVIDNLSLNIRKGEFLSIVGPSGCGKSTLLSIMAGLEKNFTGTVDMQEVPKGRVSFVFQSPRLLPWQNVRNNVKFSLEATKVFPKEKWDAKASEVLSIVGLSGFDRAFPNQLTGGMQTRVAIARALATEPEVLLMDEPFSSLDEITARNLRRELLSIWEKTGTTIVFVTHDINEAVFMADRILLLTSRPARLHREVSIDLDRPRSYSNPILVNYEAQLLAALEEVLERAAC